MNLKNELLNRLSELGTSFEMANADELYEAVALSLRPTLGSLNEAKKPYPVAMIGLEYAVSDLLIHSLKRLELYDEFAEILSERGMSVEDICAHEEEPRLGAGELGKVCFDFLKSASIGGLDIIGYGIKYKRGYFKQKLVDEQIELIDRWRHSNHPAFFVRKGDAVKVDLNVGGGESLYAVPTDLPLASGDGKGIQLRFFEASYDRKLDDSDELLSTIYPSERDYKGKLRRLVDSSVLISASIEDLRRRNGSILNTGIIVTDHELFMVVPLLIKAYMNEGCDFESAEAMLNRNLSFLTVTTYNIWSKEIDADLIKAIFPEEYEILGRLDCGLRLNTFEQARILVNNSKEIIGLSESYIKNLREITFKDVAPEKFRVGGYGVNLRRVIGEYNPELERIIALGSELDCTAQEFEKHLVKRKRVLAEKIYTKSGMLINPSAVFIAHIGGYFEYKRLLLTLLEIIRRYKRLIKNPNEDILPTVFFIEGYANPDYDMAKRLVKLAIKLAKKVNSDLRIKDKLKVVVLENMRRAEEASLLSALDLYIHASLPDNAAYGMGKAEALANGCAVLTTHGGLESEYFHYFGPADNMRDIGVNYEHKLLKEHKQALHALIDGSLFDKLEFDREYASVHGGGDYFRIMRDFEEFGCAIDKFLADYRNRDYIRRVIGIEAAKSFSADGEVQRLRREYGE